MEQFIGIVNELPFAIKLLLFTIFAFFVFKLLFGSKKPKQPPLQKEFFEACPNCGGQTKIASGKRLRCADCGYSQGDKLRCEILNFPTTSPDDFAEDSKPFCAACRKQVVFGRPHRACIAHGVILHDTEQCATAHAEKVK
ncbi:MAG TPA: hypothetical protein VEA59_07320 [Patescibacteria group bacterium]|nr:hypothetical protein [Patescibacteria group bacterium]